MLASIPWVGVLIVGVWSAADLYIATLLLLGALPELAHVLASKQQARSIELARFVRALPRPFGR